MRNYDPSTILLADSILVEDAEAGKEKIKRAEILGFIGDDYQRFNIHFVSMIQNPTNPYQYLVYGKTKVKQTICAFQGTITVREAKLYTIGDLPTYQQGFANCEVLLFEDNKQASTGFIKGSLKSEFLIDPKGQFRYDALQFDADGIANNQFVGTWTSYKTKVLKKCQWGDYRIPECGDLDIGAGEFAVHDKYRTKGWQSYHLASGYDNADELKVKQALNIESEQWWK